MATIYDSIDDKLRDWLLAQPVFFVATAPLTGDGHVNVSPKGIDGTLAVLGPLQVAYLDYFGSGIETVAHLRENGRIVIMCCAFSGAPKIVRLHGRGRALHPGDAEFAALRPRFGKDRDRGLRSIVVVDVERVADSCGFAVPLMEFVGDRDVLDRAQERREPEYFDLYGVTRNATSIDRLPGLP
ncbi:MAG: pyridoxamine 5'-phosphate oxidase family protein [Jatrophihabitans sp.]|uniref:pyridoxamine 5'-phosphate oxidase family protein n=1 Tax=Jatrophihabitans sp. TaxID=1932789 RepID=UPI003914E9EB